MTEPTAETKFGRWTAPEVPLSIEYRPELMGELRGAESGVLFGEHANDSVRILAWRRIAFSASQHRDLLRLLLAAKQDSKLEALQPVGWFVSHGGIALSAADIEIFDGFFAEPWQITLVVNGARAGFFVRDAGGRLRSESSYREFAIEAPAPKAKYLRWLWAIPTLLAMVLAGLLIKPQRPEPVNPGFFLRVQGDGPVSTIIWDANSVPVRAASRAELDIQDGQPSHFAITAAQLRAGQMSWQRHSGDVEVRMTLYPANGSAVREFARLLVSTVRVPVEAPKADPDVKKLTQELHQERVRSDRLQKMVKILENRIQIESSRK